MPSRMRGQNFMLLTKSAQFRHFSAQMVETIRSARTKWMAPNNCHETFFIIRRS